MPAPQETLHRYDLPPIVRAERKSFAESELLYHEVNFSLQKRPTNETRYDSQIATSTIDFAQSLVTNSHYAAFNEYMGETEHRIPLAYTLREYDGLGKMIYFDASGVNFTINTQDNPWEQNDGVRFSSLSLLDLKEGEDKDKIIEQLARFMSPQDLISYLRRHLV